MWCQFESGVYCGRSDGPLTYTFDKIWCHPRHCVPDIAQIQLDSPHARADFGRVQRPRWHGQQTSAKAFTQKWTHYILETPGLYWTQPPGWWWCPSEREGLENVQTKSVHCIDLQPILECGPAKTCPAQNCPFQGNLSNKYKNLIGLVFVSVCLCVCLSACLYLQRISLCTVFYLDYKVLATLYTHLYLTHNYFNHCKVSEQSVYCHPCKELLQVLFKCIYPSWCN